MELKIEKNVPMPRCRRNRRFSAHLVRALESMHVGDSVLVQEADTASLSAYCHVIGKKLGRRFVRRGQRIWLVGQRPVPGNPNRVPDAELCDAICGLMKKHPDWNLWHLGMVMRDKYGVSHQYVRRFYEVFVNTKRAARRKAQRPGRRRDSRAQADDTELHGASRSLYVLDAAAGTGKSVVLHKRLAAQESA